MERNGNLEYFSLGKTNYKPKLKRFVGKIAEPDLALPMVER
jgi:hypothetical protein